MVVNVSCLIAHGGRNEIGTSSKGDYRQSRATQWALVYSKRKGLQDWSAEATYGRRPLHCILLYDSFTAPPVPSRGSFYGIFNVAYDPLGRPAHDPANALPTIVLGGLFSAAPATNRRTEAVVHSTPVSLVGTQAFVI